MFRLFRELNPNRSIEALSVVEGGIMNGDVGATVPVLIVGLVEDVGSKELP